MATMKIWYDEEGDYLEIRTGNSKGHMKDLGDDIWERIDEKGKIIGLGILGFKKSLKANKGEIHTPLTVSFS